MIIVSACLAGIKCSHDGKARECRKVSELVSAGKAVPACPEMLGGFPSPRERIELRDGRAFTESGKDVTDAVKNGAEAALLIAQRAGCGSAVLKARSPSCGCGMVYDGTFCGKLVDGDGVFAAMLKKNGIKVVSEEEFTAVRGKI
jgi:uncharacterized protein YbbK (DUF523 family)